MNETVRKILSKVSEPEGRCARYVILTHLLTEAGVQLTFYYNEDHFAYRPSWADLPRDVVSGALLQISTNYQMVVSGRSEAMRITLQFRHCLDTEELGLLYEALTRNLTGTLK